MSQAFASPVHERTYQQALSYERTTPRLQLAANDEKYFTGSGKIPTAFFRRRNVIYKKVAPCCKQENAAVVAYVYQREVWAVPISVLSPSSAISQKVGRKQHRGGGRGKNAFAVEIRVDAFSSLHFTSSLLPLLARIRSFLSPEKKSNSPISLTNHELFFSPFSSYAIFATEMRSHMWKGGRNIKVVRSKTHPGKTGPDTLTCGKGGGGAKKACQRLFPPERNLMNAACVAAAMMCLREEIQRNTELSQSSAVNLNSNVCTAPPPSSFPPCSVSSDI